VAVLEGDGRVAEKRVVSAAEVAARVEELLAADVREVVVGSGTGSTAVAARLRAICEANGVGLAMVEERGSTALARMLYFRDNPRRGWRRLVPVSFLTPSEAFDDYGAIVIGRRYLASKGAVAGGVDGDLKKQVS
jgi:hypothetical protein